MTAGSGPVVSAATQVLAHTPGLAHLGAKPSRTLPGRRDLAARFAASLRPYGAAVAYPPHRASIGACHPRDLPPRPWASTIPAATGWDSAAAADLRFGPDGEIMPEPEFLGLLAAADAFDLVTLSPAACDAAVATLARHPLAKWFDLDGIARHAGDAGAVAAEPGALTVGPPATGGSEVRAAVRRAHDDDDALAAPVILENLAAKATATLALLHLLHGRGIDPESVEFVLGCGEEAVGDRYQRGGGNLGKAIAEEAGCRNASGSDVKAFCAGPIHALVVAASLVSAGVYQHVAVVAGGSLAKLGMKFAGALRHDVPVLEDVLAGLAILVGPPGDGAPTIRLDAVGRHKVGSGSAQQAVLEDLVVEPLERLGRKITDVERYATELHDPEITEPAGAGNVPQRNYKLIGALAVKRGELARDELDSFERDHGLPGFSPTQGHVASAVPWLPHGLQALRLAEIGSTMLVAKGSLFLGRMTELADGMSILIEPGKE
jgi:hypothetical protein